MLHEVFISVVVLVMDIYVNDSSGAEQEWKNELKFVCAVLEAANNNPSELHVQIVGRYHDVHANFT